MLPTFLGIGAPKAGTSWVHRLLESHPDVLVPTHRKEIHYFDLNFQRGPSWYEQFFGAGNGAPSAVGEITPHYLYDPAAPRRVRSIPTVGRFIVIVRNPVDRAFSHFRFRRRQDGGSLSFEEFIERDPTALAWGFYGRHLADWFGEFGRSRFLVLVYESAVRDPGFTKRQIAEHLSVAPDGFPPAAGVEKVNADFVPRRRRVYATAVRQARWLRKHDLDSVITVAKRIGVVDQLKQPAVSSPPETVPPRLRAQLWEAYAPDVELLEELTGLDLAGWRPEAA